MRLAQHTLVALLALLAGPAWSQPCAPKLPAASLVQPGTLQLAINPTLPPQQFVDEKGELQGLNVELGRELGNRLCVATEFVRMDFPAMVPALRAGRFDGIVGVLMALEVVRLVRRVDDEGAASSPFPFALEVIAFSDEEGTRFGKALLG